MEITDVTNKRNTIDDILIEEEFIEEEWDMDQHILKTMLMTQSS